MSRPVNYVFVFLTVFSQEGGIQSYVKDILKAYLSISKSSQADIFLLRDALDCVNPFVSDAVRFHYFKTASAWQGRLKLALSLLTNLIQNRPKQVFCGHIKLAPLVRLLCQPLGIPYIILTYGKDAWEEPLTPLERQALQQASQIWTISRYSQEQLCQANHIAPDKVRILPCMVDGERFTPQAKPDALIQKYGLTNAKVLMTVARLWSGDIHKGVDVTIRALPKILQVYPEVKYLVIGRGDDQPRLAKLAAALGVSQQVIFAGFIPDEALIDHYRVADAYIMPSQEGFGIAYLEAMACGIPVLSGDDDGSADPLQDGRLGWRVPFQDPEAVAAACIEILAGDDRRCNGQWLREQTLRQFNQKAFTEKLKILLN